jgi:hypothetical protein
MKSKTHIIIAATILTIISAASPGSAIESNSANQQSIDTQQKTLLAGKGGTVKGGHSSSKSPSKANKHQKGQAQRNEDQNVNPAFKSYKTNGGRLSKGAWQKAGMPSK